MHKVKAIIYKSKALLSDIDLNELLRKARIHNSQHQITGILVTVIDGFYQYIEGPEDYIDSLYHRIVMDERHHDVTKIYEHPLTHRRFHNWSMGYLNLIHVDDLAQIENHENIVEEFQALIERIMPLELDESLQLQTT